MFNSAKNVLDNIKDDDVWEEGKVQHPYELDVEDIVYYKVELSKLISQARKSGIEVTNTGESIKFDSRGETAIVRF